MKRLACAALAFLAIFSTAACSTAGRAAARGVAEGGGAFDIPRLDNITIDGDAADWKDAGFHINMLTSRTGKVKLVDDLDARARLAYDQRGLLFLLTVRDDVPNETERIWDGDSVELFISDAAVSPQAHQYQVLMTPGIDPKYPEGREPRLVFTDRRSEELKKVVLAPEYGRKPLLENGKTVGYVLEMRLPWEQLGMVAEVGREVKFQFVVNDLDVAASSKFKLAWFPRDNMHHQPGDMYTLRLSDKASTAIDAVASVDRERFRRTVVTVLGTEEAAGMMVVAEMRRDGKPVKVEGVLSKKDGRSECKLLLPLSEEEERLIVSIGQLTLHA